MEFVATSKYVRVSPRKARAVATIIKGLSPAVAMEKLPFFAKSASQPIFKTLQSAIANSKLKIEDLKIKNILIDEGTKMKRRDKSHGARYDSGVIQKRTSHIKVILSN